MNRKHKKHCIKAMQEAVDAYLLDRKIGIDARVTDIPQSDYIDVDFGFDLTIMFDTEYVESEGYYAAKVALMERVRATQLTRRLRAAVKADLLQKSVAYDEIMEAQAIYDELS